MNELFLKKIKSQNFLALKYTSGIIIEGFYFYFLFLTIFLSKAKFYPRCILQASIQEFINVLANCKQVVFDLKE